MQLSWPQSILYSLIAGLTDIFPVSSQAHKMLMMKLFGVNANLELMNLMIHIGVLAALYMSTSAHLVRFSRARALARVPKRKRRRPLDVRSLMDLRLLQTMLVPIVIGLFLYQNALPKGQEAGTALTQNVMLLPVFLLINGIVLYTPQFLPGSNRDSRTLSRVEGFFMGLGCALSLIPGLSAIGLAISIGSVCGVERNFGLNMAMLANMVLTIGLIVYDILTMSLDVFSGLGILLILQYLAALVVAFAAAMLAIRALRKLVELQANSMFALYSIGLALFTFILNLLT